MRGTHHPMIIHDSNGTLFAIPYYDSFIGRFMLQRGTYDDDELSFLLSLISPGDTVVEVGANIGPYSVHIGRYLSPSGLLYSFEPFRLIYQILTANIAMNGISNVVTVNAGAASGSTRDVEANGPNLNVADNYGGASLLNMTERTWEIQGAIRQKVRVMPLDEFAFERRINFIKIDVEGMEYEVLRGAERIVKKDRPVVYAENSSVDKVTKQSFEDFMWNGFHYSCHRPGRLSAHFIVICSYSAV